MNDKTEQSVTDEPRGTAAGGHAEIINAPGYPLMVRAVDYNALRAQLAEAQRDAARYRTLRSLWFQFGTMANIRTEPGISLHRINMAGDLHTLDVAIDAAKGPA